MYETEAQEERRLARECATVSLGRLGNRDDINVAKVEVQWWSERAVEDLDGQLTGETATYYEGGYYLVHAGDVENIYDDFDRLVTEKLEARVEAGLIDGYDILDTYAA